MSAGWRQQLAQATTTLESLRRVVGPGPSRMLGAEAFERYPAKITPYYLSVLSSLGWPEPLARMVLPDRRELDEKPRLGPDPFDERWSMPVEGLVRRYRDRVLLLTTSVCAVHCRFCTRRWFNRSSPEHTLSTRAMRAIVQYLKENPGIREVILSGGDPLTLTNARLGRILDGVRSVPSVQVVRLHTRVPVVLPMRITPSLGRLLASHHPLFMNVHVNHPDEMTPQAHDACTRLADSGIPLGSQTVLLAGINDRVEVLAKMCRRLLAARVRPYYLLQCDRVAGTEHWWVPVRRGLELIEALRNSLSGLAVPRYVVDLPGQEAKLPAERFITG